MQVIQVRIATVFMLDPDIIMLIKGLTEKGYITARVRPTLEGATVVFIEPPNVIAGKGTVRIDYDFARRVLGIESPSSKEVINALNEVEDLLKEGGIDIEKALVPYEAVVIAEESLKPRFSDNLYNFEDVLGFNLRSAGISLVMEGGDPSSNKWFHMNILPLWSAYKTGDKENRYRITITYRGEKLKLLSFLENLENILKRMFSEV